MMGFGIHWHQEDYMQTICTSLQTDNHTNMSLLIFLQAGGSSCHPTNSNKALKASNLITVNPLIISIVFRSHTTTSRLICHNLKLKNSQELATTNKQVHNYSVSSMSLNSWHAK